MISKLTLMPSGEPGSEMLAKAAEAVGFIKRMELPQASKAINEALQLDARNTHLHFLNGFVYHLQARQGDTQKNEMAIEGYQQALRMDPGNWIAQEFLGLAYLDLKQFDQAKTQFSDVLLLSPDSQVSVYGRMVSSYMTGDPVTACAMADRFREASHEVHAGFIRSSVAVYASCGEFDKADQMRVALGHLKGEPAEVERVDRRLADWKSVYRTRGANAEPPVWLKTSDTSAASQDAPPSAPTAIERPEAVNDGTPRMVLVDVVMVSTQELVTTAKGINLLTALSLQLGSSSAPAYGKSVTVNSAVADATTVITRAVTVPALAYSLNIANAANNLSEVLARPTLAAIDGQTSEFFSGTNLNAAVVSTNSLGNASAVPVDKRFGVKLAVTPGFLPNGMVKLKVEAQRTFLNANVDTAGFAYRLEISETSSNANVVMNLGDTLVLSGLSEKESSSSRTGVPGLQDIPGVQYLFSTKRNSNFQRSVLILITPRAPIYTDKASRGPNAGMSDSMKALREKLGFSAKTPSNIESILNHLRSTTLFRDFRQGDVSLERWDRMHSTGDRLRQALDFLYY
ncbi:MAG: secretion protein [Pseudomonadota bacterium]